MPAELHWLHVTGRLVYRPSVTSRRCLKVARQYLTAHSHPSR